MLLLQQSNSPSINNYLLLGKSLPFGQLFSGSDPTKIRQNLQESLSLRRGALFSLPMNLTALVSTTHYKRNGKIIKRAKSASFHAADMLASRKCGKRPAAHSPPPRGPRSEQAMLGKSLPFGQLFLRGLTPQRFDKICKRVFRFGEGLSSRYR